MGSPGPAAAGAKCDNHEARPYLETGVSVRPRGPTC